MKLFNNVTGEKVTRVEIVKDPHTNKYEAYLHFSSGAMLQVDDGEIDYDE